MNRREAGGWQLEALECLPRPRRPDFVPLFAHLPCNLQPKYREYSVEFRAATGILLAFCGSGNTNPTVDHAHKAASISSLGE
jgi:hypothetical protein